MNTPLRVYRAGIGACVLASVSILSLHAQHPLDSWARRAVPGFTTNLSTVAFGNGVFVAVGDGSAVVTSPDGANWTVSAAGSYGNLARVRFLNRQFVAVCTTDK